MASKGKVPEARRRWTPREMDLLRDFHGQGMSLTKAAKELGRSKSGVSRKAKDMGLSWEMSDTIKRATQIRRDRIEEARTQRQLADQVLLDHLQEQAFSALDLLTDPEVVFWKKGRGGEMIPQPVSRETPLPLEEVERIHRIVSDSIMLRAKIDNMTISKEQADERADSLLRTFVEKAESLTPQPDALEENKEEAPKSP